MIRARFVWKDGYVDYSNTDRRPIWSRHRWDRADIREKEKAVITTQDWICSTADVFLELAVFERVIYNDGSFEYRER